MLRRFLLVGLMVVVHNGEMIQLIIGTLIAAILLFFQVQAAPYNDMSDDYLAAASSFSLLILFLCCITFKYAALVELPDIQQRISIEQMQIYVVDPGVLTAIMMVSIIASLPVAAVLFLIQLAAEGARLRREALARRAALRLPTCEWQLAEGQSYVCLCFRRLNAGLCPPLALTVPRSLCCRAV